MARTKSNPKRIAPAAFALDRAEFTAALRRVFADMDGRYRVQASAVDALYEASAARVDGLIDEARVAAEFEGSELDARHVALALRMLA